MCPFCTYQSQLRIQVSGLPSPAIQLPTLLLVNPGIWAPPTTPRPHSLDCSPTFKQSRWQQKGHCRSFIAMAQSCPPLPPQAQSWGWMGAALVSHVGHPHPLCCHWGACSVPQILPRSPWVLGGGVTVSLAFLGLQRIVGECLAQGSWWGEGVRGMREKIKCVPLAALRELPLPHGRAKTLKHKCEGDLVPTCCHLWPLLIGSWAQCP